MNDRERLWTAADALIEALGRHFGIFKGQAKATAYDTIMKKLSDQEVATAIAEVTDILNSK